MLKLTLVTPEKKLLTNIEVSEVIVPAHAGQLDILPGHAPLMTTLTAGVLKIRMADTTEKKASISWGYLEVNPQGVRILAETAEWPEDIDKSRAEQNYNKAVQRMQAAGLGPDDYALANKKIQKEKARLEALNS